MKLVAAACLAQYANHVVLFEPPESGLPAGLLASSALVKVSRGTVYVVNVGTIEVILRPATLVAQHLERLAMVQDRLEKEGLKVKLEKCAFFKSEVKRFVEGFAKLPAPLHRLVAEVMGGKTGKRRGQSLVQVWTEQCQTAFSVLAYADFAKPFILEVDASHGGLGAVLSQESEGKIRPVAYASPA
ncbi:hypothetical protein QQF64_019987 [Cirrhinus molitorella]|uniref:Reverse transcriptase/retrotransposon-derived protein RNase H-like domain-containing protein n=1 Tax=Cirrhinus molitorella TaxID=172907 RepID=A0ABR3LJI6_9TELE